MSKKGIVFLISAICLCLCLSSSYAQNTESITISTYYPSPYGNYHEMRAQRVAIGDNYIFGDQYCWAPEACITTIAPDADLVVEGNVGIGTVLPDSPLTIERQTGNAELHIQAADNFYNNWNGIRMRRARGSMSAKALVQDQDDLSELNTQTWINNDWLNVASIEVRVDGTPNTNVPTKMVFHTALPNLPDMQERMVINSAGRVGIGTSTPEGRLEIHAASNATLPALRVWHDSGQQIYLDSPGGASVLSLRVNNSPKGLICAVGWGGGDCVLDSQPNDLVIRSDSGAAIRFSESTLKTEMIIAGTNVGIGTTNPGSRLSVHTNGVGPYFEGGDTNFTRRLVISSSNTTNQGDTHTLNAESISGVLAFATGGTERMRIAETGNVGIGTTDPGGYRLNVNGAIYTSGGCTGCSDARWKTNIMPISAPLDKIMALKGVQFNWRTKEYPRMFFQEGLDYGLVAQDVEKTLSEIVYEDNGYKYIRYDRLSAILIEATKEQQKQINQLKQELAQQKAELDSLKEKM